MPKLFIDYTPNQLQLPLSYEEIIPKNHLVRVVNSIVDELDLSTLYDRYAGGGRPAYHPQMMLKIMIFAYSEKIYSSRQIAKAIRENINFIWLAGGNRPDFRTINRFRSDMKDVIEDVFYEVVKLLIDNGYIRMENYFLDGTKIEANANKYTFVWNKAVKGYDKKLDAKVREHLRQIDEIVAEENYIYLDEDLEELGENQTLTSHQLEGVIESIDAKLCSDPKNRQLKKTSRIFKQDLLPRKKKYERSNEIFEGRSSYSKTDHDATFMRMKEDHMLNGQLKPGYNIQIGTENNFIVGFTIHPNPTDTKTLIPHLEHLKKKLGKLPKNIIADSGYGSEENYGYLQGQDVNAYVKYNKFHWEKKKKNRENPFLTDNLRYDPLEDRYICPIGRPMPHIYRTRYKTEAGYDTFRDVYQCVDCEGCPYGPECKKSSGPRKIRVSHKLNEMKKRANDLLCSETGIILRKRRVVEVEQTFGRLKGCWGFRRFLLRGKNKVKVEWGLLSIAHNITKMALDSC